MLLPATSSCQIHTHTRETQRFPSSRRGGTPARDSSTKEHRMPPVPCRSTHCSRERDYAIRRMQIRRPIHKHRSQSEHATTVQSHVRCIHAATGSPTSPAQPRSPVAGPALVCDQNETQRTATACAHTGTGQYRNEIAPCFLACGHRACRLIHRRSPVMVASMAAKNRKTGHQ
jgi:hypothetical protein